MIQTHEKIKIKEWPLFRRIVTELVNSKELAINPTVIQNDLGISKGEFFKRFLFSDSVNSSDFDNLIKFLKNHIRHSKKELEESGKTQLFTAQVNNLISLVKPELLNKPAIKPETKKIESGSGLHKSYNLHISGKAESSVEDKPKEIKKLEDNEITVFKGKPCYPYYSHNRKAFCELIKLLGITENKFKKKTGISLSTFALLKNDTKKKFIFLETQEPIVSLFQGLIFSITDKEKKIQANHLMRSLLDYKPGPGETPIAVKPKGPNKSSRLKALEIPVKNKVTSSSQALPGTLNNIPDKVADKKEKKAQWDSKPYTPEMANAFRTLNFILKISQSAKANKLPVANSNWSKLKTGLLNGKPFNASRQTMEKVIDFIIPFINNKYQELSGQEQETLKQCFEIFSGLEFSVITLSPGNSTESKRTTAAPKTKELSFPEINQIQNIDVTFLNRHRELIKTKLEADRRLEEILLSRDAERYKRDREQNIKNAFEDIEILSLLALSKQSEYYREVYEIKDFALIDPEAEKPADMYQVDFIMDERPAGYNKILFLSELESQDYWHYRAKVKHHYDFKNVNIKLKLDKYYRLFLLLHFGF